MPARSLPGKLAWLAKILKGASTQTRRHGPFRHRERVAVKQMRTLRAQRIQARFLGEKQTAALVALLHRAVVHDAGRTQRRFRREIQNGRSNIVSESQAFGQFPPTDRDRELILPCRASYVAAGPMRFSECRELSG